MTVALVITGIEARALLLTNIDTIPVPNVRTWAANIRMNIHESVGPACPHRTHGHKTNSLSCDYLTKVSCSSK